MQEHYVNKSRKRNYSLYLGSLLCSFKSFDLMAHWEEETLNHWFLEDYFSRADLVCLKNTELHCGNCGGKHHLGYLMIQLLQNEGYLIVWNIMDKIVTWSMTVISWKKLLWSLRKEIVKRKFWRWSFAIVWCIHMSKAPSSPRRHVRGELNNLRLCHNRSFIYTS